MSVQEIIKNEKYKIDLFLGRDKNGKVIRHIEYFRGGLKQARLKENELKIQLKEGNSIQKSYLTFKELTREYLEIQKDKLSITTYITYEQRVGVINEYLGHIKLKDLNTKILEKFYHYLRNDYVSERTNKKLGNTSIQHYYTLINGIIEQAIKWDYIKTNPNSKIDKPKRDRREIEVYSKEEVIQLLECVKKEPLKYQVIVYLALDLGCRLGELTALTWNDINFDTREVNINKSTQFIKGKVIEKETKSLHSDRRVFISDTTLSILKKYRHEQKMKKVKLGEKWKNSNRILTTNFGDDIHHDTPSKIFKKILKRYGLKEITFHGLRHTNASLKIREGIQTQIVSRSLGHSSVQITDKYYSHFFEEEFKEVSNILDKEVFSKVN